MNDSEVDDGQSSVTSRTTLTSAATTVRTASTAAYGRGNYLLPPPHLCGVDMEEDEEEEDDVRSVRSKSSRRSSGTAKSKASQGTVATIKNYIRHRQRQRLRRREEQQQIDLFNQWAETQMASSSELSPSSKSSAVSSAASGEDREAPRGRLKAGGARGGRGRHHQDAFSSTLKSHVGGDGGGHDHWLPPQQQRHRRSSSVASSAPRPPEEVLAEGPIRYSFLVGTNGDGHDVHREQEHLQAGFPATPNNFFMPTEFGPHGYTPRSGGEAGSGAAVPHTHTPVNTSLHADPQQLPPPHGPPRRQKRTWKNVEHNVALSGFFNSPANNSFNGAEARDDDEGELPAPFRNNPAEPSHSPLGRPSQPRE